MPKKLAENLISQLHDTFAGAETSAQQALLMQNLKDHMHHWDEPESPDPTLADTVELLLDEVGQDHPKAATIIKQLLETLKNIGI